MSKSLKLISDICEYFQSRQKFLLGYLFLMFFLLSGALAQASINVGWNSDLQTSSFSSLANPQRCEIRDNPELKLLFSNLSSAFSQHYAFSDFKQKTQSWSLLNELAQIPCAIKDRNHFTHEDLKSELLKTIQGASDPHLKIAFESTARSHLPIQLRCFDLKVQQKTVNCFISWIEPKLGDSLQLFVGDQILSIDGISIFKALNSLFPLKDRPNVGADLRIAETFAFDRAGHMGHKVPKGEFWISIVRKGQISERKLDWISTEEGVEFDPLPRDQSAPQKIPPQSPPSIFKFKSALNPFTRGNKIGYLPMLGQPILKTPPASSFFAYSFKHNNRVFGSLRLPTFHVLNHDQQIQEYKRWIGIFESSTDALVVDVSNNPGGSVTFMNAVASLMTNRELHAMQFQRTLGADDVRRAVALKQLASLVNDDLSAKSVFGNSLQGFPMSYAMVKSLLIEANSYLSSWKSKFKLTPPGLLEGVDIIRPFPLTEEEKKRGQPGFYTKPILIITDERTMSSAEFFTAILVDNGRASTIGIGQSTAGGGGTVRDVSFPNSYGIHHLTLTDSIAIRPNGQWIEEIGVPAQSRYQESAADLLNSYQGFKDLVLNKLMEATIGK